MQAVEEAMKGINSGLDKYEQVKRGCVERRDNYLERAEKGVEDIVKAIEHQIDFISKDLDIPRFK